MSEQRRDNTDLIRYDTAAAILGVRPRTLQLRIQQERLTRYRSPLDRRVKFLDRAEVEQLLRFDVYMPRKRAA